MNDKLSIVIDRYWPMPGGVEQAATSLAAHLSKQFEIKIVTHYMSESKSLYFSYSRRPQYQAFKDPSGNSICVVKPGGYLLLPLILWQFPFLRKQKAPELFDRLYRFYRIAFRKKLQKLLKGSAIVHCFSTGYLARLTTEICKDENTALIHSPYIHFGKWGDSPEQIKAYKSADALICPTSAFKKRFVSLYGCCPCCEIIPPITPEPVKPSNSLPPPVTGRYILFLGRREAHKGIDMLIEAFIGMEEHDISLVVAGPGKPLKVSNPRIHDLGPVTDDLKARLLTDCDLLCVPSTDETFGIVYTEAMSYGKPVTALDVPPVNEIVENEKTGILVNPNNTGSLRSALSRLVSDDRLRISMGNSGRERFIDHYCGEKIAGEILHLYNEITASRR